MVGLINLVSSSPVNSQHLCTAHASYACNHNKSKRDRTEVRQAERLSTAMDQASDAPMFAITPAQHAMITALNDFINLNIADEVPLSKKAVQNEATRLAP